MSCPPPFDEVRLVSLTSKTKGPRGGARSAWGGCERRRYPPCIDEYAEGGTRTPTPSRAHAPKACASAIPPLPRGERPCWIVAHGLSCRECPSRERGPPGTTDAASSSWAGGPPASPRPGPS